MSMTNNQSLTEVIAPSDNSIVQANITELGDVAHVSAKDPMSYPVALPDQTPVQMLSRLRVLAGFNWSFADTGILYTGDLESMLRNNTEHAPLLKQYHLYRSDFKLVVRINTNQFYSGALMISWWVGPRDNGTYRQQRALFHPVTISAATQQSAEIDIPYAFAQDYLFTLDRTGDGTMFRPQNLWFTIEVLAKLTPASPTVPDYLNVQVFGSYRNPKLQFNRDGGTSVPLVAPGVTHQSKMVIKKDPKGQTSIDSTFSPSPALDAAKRGNGKSLPFSEIAPTLYSIPILGTVAGAFYDLLKIGTGAITDLAPTVGALAPLAPLLLDKPEQMADTTRVRPTIDSDNFSSDVADASTAATYSKKNYLRGHPESGVKLGSWTLAQYAAIPGLHRVDVIRSSSTNLYYYLSTSPTPLGLMYKRFTLWKGSIKVKLQIFASSFVSTRLAFMVFPRADGLPTANVDDYIVRIIEVKGDTDVEMTIPYISPLAWSNSQTYEPFAFALKVISDVVGFDSSTDPVITVATWVAGGPDMQFAQPAKGINFSYLGTSPLPPLPEPPTTADTTSQKPTSFELLRRPPKKPLVAPGVEQQCSISQSFSKSFDPIVDQCNYFVDNGRVVSDVPVTFNDLCKRYHRASGSSPEFTQLDMTMVSDRAIEGMHFWLQMFSVWRGGFRIKFRIPGDPASPPPYQTACVTSYFSYEGFGWAQPGADGWYALSIPWTENVPFLHFGEDTPFSSVVFSQSDDVITDVLIALRDDLELGLPILPLSDP